MAVAWNRVRDALWDQLPGVVPAGVKSYNGPLVSGNSPSAYLTVGHAPSSPDDTGGLFTQENGPDGYTATEDGFVVCELGAVTGTANVPSVFAAFDAIASHIQSDMTLGGVLAPGSTVTVGASVVEAQTKSGAVQRLIVTVQYLTRI